MKFPVTREQLQAYTVESYQAQQVEEGIQKKINEYVTCLCNEFVRDLPRDSASKQFVWVGLHLIPKTPEEKYLQYFIERLKTLFVDCTIRTNEARTYVVIDWS